MMMVTRSTGRWLLSLGLLGALCCAGCEDDPHDLDFLRDAGGQAKPDAGTDGGAQPDAAAADAGVDAAVSGNDGGSADGG